VVGYIEQSMGYNFVHNFVDNSIDKHQLPTCKMLGVGVLNTAKHLNVPHVLKAYDLEAVGIVQLDYERTA
jgi:hypothetical protein